MPKAGLGMPVAPTNIAPASSARTSGPRTSSATRASPRDSSASSALKKLVHPAEACAAERWMKIRSSDQFVFRLMDRQDLQLEELLVAEPISLPLHRLDLGVSSGRAP